MSGKRIAKYLPKGIGAWLAGLYDNDKQVARAAQTALSAVFPNQEKRRNVWKFYQTDITEYAAAAIIHESIETLSDERTVSPDDAQAKHVRVVATASMMLNTLLSILSNEELQESTSTITSLLQEPKLWQNTSHPDAFVRRGLYRLLQTCLATQEGALDFRMLSTTLIAHGLNVNQTGSALDFSEALKALTDAYPDVWTTAYKSKTPSSRRLRQYLKKGSQAAPRQFWINTEHLLHSIPHEVIFSENDSQGFSTEAASELLAALHEGVINREEARDNHQLAWAVYVDVTIWISTSLPEGSRSELLDGELLPLIEQFLVPSPERSRWNIQNTPGINICAACFRKLIELGMHAYLEERWGAIAHQLVENMRISLPEQSQDYRTSQDAISAQAHRWFDLQAAILSSESLDSIITALRNSSMQILQGAIELLKSRNGKPYSAAVFLEESIRQTPQLVFENEGLTQMISEFLARDMSPLLLSPSSESLLSTLFAWEGHDGFQPAVDAAISIFIAQKGTPADSNQAFLKLIRLVNFDNITRSQALQNYINADAQDALSGNQHSWSTVTAALQNPSFSADCKDRLLASMMERLSTEDTAGEALKGLEIVATENKAAIDTFVESEGGSKMLSQVLFLADSHNESLAEHAVAVEMKLKAVFSDGKGIVIPKPTIDMIKHNLHQVGPTSLS